MYGKYCLALYGSCGMDAVELALVHGFWFDRFWICWEMSENGHGDMEKCGVDCLS